MSHIKLILKRCGFTSLNMEALLSDALKIRCFQRIICTLAKAGSDFVFVLWNDSVSIRSINKSQSALPIVQFKREFFDSFNFSHYDSQFVFEIPTSCLKLLMKPIFMPQSIKWNVDPNEFICSFDYLDCYDINHHWTFGISETALFNAVVNMDNVTTSINCRCDIFEGIDKAFKGNRMVSLIISEKKDRGYHAVLQTQELNSCEGLSSILRIENGEKCEITRSGLDDNNKEYDEYGKIIHNKKKGKHGYQLNEKKNSTEISFILSDFFIGIKISEILSQRAAIYCTTPGGPIVMKAAIPNTVYFEMTMATSAEGAENEEEDAENEWCENENENIKRKDERERDWNENTPILYVPDTSCVAPSSTRIHAHKNSLGP